MANIVYKSAANPSANNSFPNVNQPGPDPYASTQGWLPKSTATVISATMYAKGDVLTNAEIDGNFRSVQADLESLFANKANSTSPAITTPTISGGTFTGTSTFSGTQIIPSIQGSTSASGTLQLTSTSHTTKGSLLLGVIGDTVRLSNTTINGVVYTSGSNGTVTYDSTYHYRDGGTDVKVTDGGTGVSTVPTNGQLLIGNGSGYTVANVTGSTGLSVTNGAGTLALANTGVTSVAGTSNQVNVNASTGGVTFSLPQDIATTSTPGFSQVLLTNDPSQAMHAATRQYVDNAILGLDVKASVIAATLSNISLSGTQTIDGVALTAGMRVLVKNQSTIAQNGIYVVAAGAWSRATDMDSWGEVPGSFVFVEQGTVNADTGWVSTANAGGTLGSTDIPWSQFAGSGAVTAGTGITVSGNQVSVSNAYVGQSTITTVGTITSGTWSGAFGAVSGANLTSITGANVTGTVANATTAVNQSGGTINATTGSFSGQVSSYNNDVGTILASYNTSASNAVQLGIYHSGGNVNIVNSRGQVQIQGYLALNASNYNSYAPTLTGSGASGTWNINVLGSAGSVAWTNVSGKPSAVSYFTNDSGYLTSSGTITNATNLTGTAGTCGYSTGGAAISYGGTGGPQVMGTSAGAAMLSFHRPGQYAINFGLDTDNVLKVGGWSMGAVSYTIIHSGNIGSQSVSYATSAGSASSANSVAWTNVSGRPTAVSSFSNDSGYITAAGRAYPRRSDGGDLNFYWSGQSGQPTWLWGGGDGTNMYVYNPSNFSVNYATTAGSAPANGGTSAAVTINYNNNSNSTYQMLWGSGNGVYGTSYITCNPSNGTIYATTFSGNIAWTNVTSRPTTVSSFTNDAGYLTAATGRLAFQAF